MIDKDGIKPTGEKVEAIKIFWKPQDIVESRRFLGLVNSYRLSLPGAAEMQQPLHCNLILMRISRSVVRLLWMLHSLPLIPAWETRLSSFSEIVNCDNCFLFLNSTLLLNICRTVKSFLCQKCKIATRKSTIYLY